VREDVVIYFETYANMLEEAFLATIEIPEEAFLIREKLKMELV
jgi:hypothetical protein